MRSGDRGAGLPESPQAGRRMRRTFAARRRPPPSGERHCVSSAQRIPAQVLCQCQCACGHRAQCRDGCCPGRVPQGPRVTPGTVLLPISGRSRFPGVNQDNAGRRTCHSPVITTGRRRETHWWSGIPAPTRASPVLGMWMSAAAGPWRVTHRAAAPISAVAMTWPHDAGQLPRSSSTRPASSAGERPGRGDPGPGAGHGRPEDQCPFPGWLCHGSIAGEKE